MIEETIKKIEFPMEGNFPSEACRRIINNKKMYIPILVGILKNAIDKPESVPKGSWKEIFAIYILAQFREKSAFPLVIRLLSRKISDEEADIDILLGNDTFLTEECPKIIGSVFDGNFSLLSNAIEDNTVFLWSRIGFINSILHLYAMRSVSYMEISKFLKESFLTNKFDISIEMWSSVAALVVDLGAKELVPFTLQVYEEGKIDSEFICLESLQKVKCYKSDVFSQSKIKKKLKLLLIEDAVNEINSFPYFH